MRGKLFSSLLRLLSVKVIKAFREEETMQDYEMIKRIRQGDRALFGQLAEKYYSEVFRYCYYQTGSEHAAYDCTQETFYHLMRFLDTYTEQNHFKAYLLRIALNVCRDYFRKNTREKPEDHELLLPEETAASDPACQPSLENQVITRAIIQNGLNMLPETQREVIILFYYHGYRQREIAQITGVPLSTIKTRLRAGIGKLQEFFRQNGLY